MSDSGGTPNIETSKQSLLSGFKREEFLMKESGGELNSPIAGNCSAGVLGVAAAESWW